MPVDAELHEDFDCVHELSIFWEYQSQKLLENWMQELDWQLKWPNHKKAMCNIKESGSKSLANRWRLGCYNHRRIIFYITQA